MKQFLRILRVIYRSLFFIASFLTLVLMPMIITDVTGNRQWLWGLLLTIPIAVTTAIYVEENA